MDTFDTSSLEACPAYCKINNVKNYKRFFCDHKTVDDLKIIPHTGDAVLIKSPKYDCNENETYPKGFMCVCSPGDRKIKGAARWLYLVYHRKYVYFPGSDVT